MNQDVRDIVVAHAVRRVADATALRRVSSTWRLAVDSYVRMLIARSQPRLMPWNGKPVPAAPDDDVVSKLSPLTLDLRERPDDDSADDLRLAFTCDHEVGIVRLALVAFALDGAKDAVQEAGWCGPREVRIVTDKSDPGPRFLGYSFHEEKTFALNCSCVARSIASCVVDPVGVLVSSKTMAIVRRALDAGAMSAIRRIQIICDGAEAVLLATTILDRFAASVGTLTITLATGRIGPEHVSPWLSAVRRCTRLSSFSIEAAPPADSQIATALFDAVADSGAPVTEVTIGVGVIDLSTIAAPLSRLRELKRANVFDVGFDISYAFELDYDLSEGEAEINGYNDDFLAPLKPQITHIEGFPEMNAEKQLEYPALEDRRLDFEDFAPEGPWSQLAACLEATRTLEITLGTSSPSVFTSPHDATLATLCPRLEHLTLGEYEPGNRLVLPPQLPKSLTALTILGIPGYAPWLESVARLPATQRPTLRRLEFDVGTAVAPALLGWVTTDLEYLSVACGFETTDARRDDSIRALIAQCAPTLRRLRLMRGSLSCDVSDVFKPTPFPRLTELSCDVDARQAEALCHLVMQQCPRIHRVTMGGADCAAMARALGATEWCAASHPSVPDVARRSFAHVADDIAVAGAPDFS